MGAAASTIPSHIDKETFRRLAGGNSLNDAVFDANQVNGVLTRDILIELSKTTDTYLACDRALDRSGRQTHQRVIAINRALRKRGIVTKFDEDVTPGGSYIANMYDAIDKARTVIVFVSSSYCSKIAVSGDSIKSTDHVQLEFNYIMKKKRPHQIIIVIMEEQLLAKDSRFVPPLVRTAIAVSPCVDMSSDSSLESRCDELYTHIATALSVREERFMGSTQVMRNTLNPFPQTAALLPIVLEPATGIDISSESVQALVQQLRLFSIPRSREEVQLYQWLERSTNISESRRVVYVSLFLRAGLTSVKLLATQMLSRADFLIGLGLSDYDADEIALAVRDLGLGSVPETDFSVASSLESASYAMHKALQEPTNHRMAANALSCVSRIASSSHDMPAAMGQARFCESVMKLIAGHMEDPASVEQGCRAFEKLATDQPQNTSRLAQLGVADLLPKLAVRHLTNSVVLENLFNVVGILTQGDVELRRRFGLTGACEVLAKGLALTLSNEACAERACYAASCLTLENYENVWKLGANGVCEQLIECLRRHPHNSRLVHDGFLAVCHLTTFEENRARFAVPGVASTLVAAGRVHLRNPQVMRMACVVMHCNIYGVAFNCKLMGEGGACELIREALITYAGLQQATDSSLEQPPDVPVLKEACIAIGILAAGNPINQAKFDGLRPLLQGIAGGNNQFPEDLRRAAQIAVTKLR